jgi:hypothetical protein
MLMLSATIPKYKGLDKDKVEHVGELETEMDINQFFGL